MTEGSQELTPARVALGRVGSSVPTAARLQLQLDHARARDAVRHAFDARGVVAALTSTGRATIAVTSAAISRDEYVRRPDLGRSLPADAASTLRESRMDGCDLAIVLCDGLSPRAIERYGPALVEQIATHEHLSGWSMAPVTVVGNGRVAIGDPIGELLGAGIVVVLIGERPGLTIAESVGAYITFGPRAGRTDAERNCISNIHSRGTAVDDAARRIANLVARARIAGATGVALTDDASAIVTPRRPTAVRLTVATTMGDA